VDVLRTYWLNATSAVLILAGIIIAFVGHDTLQWSPPPVPPAWASVPRPPAAGMPGRHRPVILAKSSPVGIDIPSIGVHARVISLGLNPDGTIAVPPLTDPMVTAWYDKGPAPGEAGAAAIVGHVDAASVGPAVFYDLGKLRPGARILIRLRNGSTAIFEAYSVALYPKAKFPTRQVFGYTSWPTLRLITCGGNFDSKTGHYLGNIVAFASFVGTRR
jgi:Sortase domain